MDVITSTGDVVKVTNIPTITRYYRGRYYRVSLTVSTTPTGFRMTSRDTFYGKPTALRWFYTEDGSEQHTRSYRFDWTHDTSEAPF